MKFECIYIDIYLIQICYYSGRQGGFRETFTLILTSFALYFLKNKACFKLFNDIKIMKFECIYIDIYLIQICHYSKRQSGFRETSALIQRIIFFFE